MIKCDKCKKEKKTSYCSGDVVTAKGIKHKVLALCNKCMVALK